MKVGWTRLLQRRVDATLTNHRRLPSSFSIVDATKEENRSWDIISRSRVSLVGPAISVKKTKEARYFQKRANLTRSTRAFSGRRGLLQFCPGGPMWLATSRHTPSGWINFNASREKRTMRVKREAGGGWRRSTLGRSLSARDAKIK